MTSADVADGDAALARDNSVDRQVGLIVEAARSAAIAADELTRAGGLDGDLRIRLIDASHALHRAFGVLTDGRAGPAGTVESP